ncbi:hypothetical protein [Humibacter sp.]|uniref:hypothetical protein n=1 Tax=Humibacter sp. TaxID=1940291 RepID=UPI003F81DD9E
MGFIVGRAPDVVVGVDDADGVEAVGVGGGGAAVHPANAITSPTPSATRAATNITGARCCVVR